MSTRQRSKHVILAGQPPETETPYARRWIEEQVWDGATPVLVKQTDTRSWVYTGSDELAAINGRQNLEATRKFVTFWGTKGNRMRLEADWSHMKGQP